MATVDEVSEVVDRGRFILDKDQYKVQSQSGQGLLVTCSVNRADIWNTLHEKITN